MPTRTLNILIIDDSRFFRLANERALISVLDMMLPKLTGTSVLKALRKDPQTAAIPVMVLTSLPQSNERKLLSEGATSYFEKSGLMLEKGSEIFVEQVQKMFSKAAGV